MKNTEIEEFDEFFLIKSSSKSENEKLQELTVDITKIVIEIFSKHLSINFIDASHLVRESANHSISIVLDIIYRLNVTQNENKNINNYDINNEINNLFSKKISELNMSSSRLLREELTNILSVVLRGKKLFKLKKEDYEIKISNVNDVQIKFDDKIYFYYILKQNVKFFFTEFFSLLFFYFKNKFWKKKNIGFIHINKRKLFQINNINFISVKKYFNFSDNQFNLESRQVFYEHNISEFIKLSKNLNTWNFFSNIKINDDVLRIFFIYIILKIDQILFDKTLFKKIIDKNIKKINKLEISSVISEGDWFKFNHALIAHCLRKLNIPLVLYYHAGGEIFNSGHLYKKGSLIFDRNHFLDYVLLSSEFKQNNIKPKYLKTPNINWFFEKKKIKISSVKNRFRILYTPITINYPYNLENMNNANPDNLYSHRKWIKELLSPIDEINRSYKFDFYIKLKNSTTNYDNFEYLYNPNLEFKNINIKFLHKGNSYSYLDFFDLHFFCGPSTTFAESMTKNIPSICLWNTNIYELDRDNMQLFENMKDVGIVCTNQKELIQSFNQFIFHNYWQTDQIQNLRIQFCKKFAYTDIDWRKKWGELLIDLIN